MCARYVDLESSVLKKEEWAAKENCFIRARLQKQFD